MKNNQTSKQNPEEPRLQFGSRAHGPNKSAAPKDPSARSVSTGQAGQIKLSPSSLNLFLECPLCFWLEKGQKVRRPQPYPYALNAAVDTLLKKEFDIYRKKGELHPLLSANNVQAKLFSDQELLNKWRNNFEGVRYYDPKLDATLFGAVDDVLEFEDGKLAPLDYKSTGSSSANIYDRFQLQMDAYAYLLEMNGYKTSGEGYLAFYIVNKEDGFESRLPFREELHTIKTDPFRVPDLFKKAVELLRNNNPPSHGENCQLGKWFKGASRF